MLLRAKPATADLYYIIDYSSLYEVGGVGDGDVPTIGHDNTFATEQFFVLKLPELHNR